MRIVSFDTESRGLDWFDPDHQAFLATYADEHGEYCVDLSKPDEASRFVDVLKGADELVAHNFPFDAHMVRATLGLDVLKLGVPIHDTAIQSRVLHPEGSGGGRGGHGLKDLAKVYLRADAGDEEEAIKAMAKEIGLRTIKQTGAYFDVWRAYPDVMEQYARMDARHTFDIDDKFRPVLEAGALRRVYELEMAVMPILIRAEERGVQTDQAACGRLKAQYEAELVDVRAYLLEQLGDEALGGTGSEDALIEALQHIGVPLYRKTPTGKLATNVYALQEFEDDFEQLAKLSEYRRLQKFLSTYIGALDGVDVVHPSFWQLGAWTGRMSVSRPSMQNLPKRAGKEVRSILVPRPGHCFVVADYEGIEARLLAYYLGDPDYRQLFRDGHDPHAFMAAQIHGGAMEMYAKGTPGEAERAVAKNTTFAIVYGAGAPRVSDMNKISLDEARSLIAQIKASLPNFRLLQKRIRDKIERFGHVNTIIGRKQVVNREKAYVGLNALIQGSAADVMKLGLVNVDKAVTPLGGVVLLVVHDEVVVECPIERADECQRLVDAALVSAWELDPPLSVESSIVTSSYADA